MIDLNLNRPDGSIIYTFPFPEHIGEISLLQYINYVVARRNAEKDDLPPMIGVAMAISEFFQVDVMPILEGEVGVGNVTEAQLAHTVGVIHVRLDEIISKYPAKIRGEEDFKFTWKGIEYLIPHLSFNAVTGKLQKTALNVYEYVEADTIKFQAQLMAEKEGDREGSIWFSEYTRLISLLARREGEKLPFKPADREVFLQNRMEVFQDVPLDIAMDIDFFLADGLRNSNPHPTIITSLILPYLLICQQAQKRVAHGQTHSKKPKAKRVSLIGEPGLGGFTAN